MQVPFIIVVEPPARAELQRVGRFWRVAAIASGIILVAIATFALVAVPTRDQSPPLAMLEVKSEPTGATVDVDGRAEGATPVHLALSPSGHHVALRRTGFVDRSYDVTLGKEQTTSLVAELWLQSP
jgi:hypothetical protein